MQPMDVPIEKVGGSALDVENNGSCFSKVIIDVIRIEHPIEQLSHHFFPMKGSARGFLHPHSDAPGTPARETAPSVVPITGNGIAFERVRRIQRGFRGTAGNPIKHCRSSSGVGLLNMHISVLFLLTLKMWCVNGSNCSVTDGLAENDGACTCGNVECTEDTGFICFRSAGGDSCRKTGFGSYGYSRLSSGSTCGDSSGRAYIRSKVNCEAAAESMGLISKGEKAKEVPFVPLEEGSNIDISGTGTPPAAPSRPPPSPAGCIWTNNEEFNLTFTPIPIGMSIGTCDYLCGYQGFPPCPGRRRLETGGSVGHGHGWDVTGATTYSHGRRLLMGDFSGSSYGSGGDSFGSGGTGDPGVSSGSSYGLGGDSFGSGGTGDPGVSSGSSYGSGGDSFGSGGHVYEEPDPGFCICLSGAPLCNHTDGFTWNSRPCRCGNFTDAPFCNTPGYCLSLQNDKDHYNQCTSRPAFECRNNDKTEPNLNDCKCGTTDCTNSTGYICDASNNKCAPDDKCDKGTYKNVTNNGACTNCPKGKWSSEFNSVDPNDCKNCPTGTWSDQTGLELEAECKKCPQGWKGIDDDQDVVKCVECDPGYYQSETGRETCNVVLPGFYGNDVHRNASTICSKGHFCKGKESDQATCEPGFYAALDGLVECISCTEGKYAALEGSTNCTDCPRNTFSASKSSSCTSCGLGEKSEPGSAKCTKCEAGEAGTGFNGTCELCTAGQYRNSSMKPASCFLCPSGWGSEKGSTKCQACEAGRATYSNVIGDTCKACHEGQYRNSGMEDATTCQNCTVGFSQSDEGQVSCIPCSPGEFNDVAGAEKCKPCSESTYFGEKERNSSCINCPTGWTAEEGSAKCVACGAGTFGDGCQFCPLGYARNGTDPDTTQCRQCRLGETTSGSSAAKCDFCDTGKFGSRPGICSTCPTGFFQDNKGEQKCLECAAGEFFVDVKTSCSGCDLGKYGSAKGHCSACPAGQYQDGKGETACKKCEVNTYLNDTGKSSKADCTKCDDDRSTSGTTGNTDDSACLCKQTKYYQNEEKECKVCPIGANCTLKDGITLEEMHARPGYWRSSNTTMNFLSCSAAHYGTDATTVGEARCCPDDLCVNATDLTSTDVQCLEGYVGPLCMVCAPTYVLRDKQCELCPDGADLVGAMTSFFGMNCLLFLLVFIVVWKTTHTEETHASDRISISNHFAGQKRILISWAQIISVVTITFNSVSWPENFSRTSNAIGLVNLDVGLLLPLASCRMSLPFELKFVLHLITPVAFGAIIKAATYSAIKLTRGRGEKSNDDAVALQNDAQQAIGHNLMLSCLLLLYPSLTTKIFTTLRCYNVEGVGKMLESDFSIPCWESEHWNYVGVAIVSIVVFIVGIPSYLLYDLWVNREHLHDTNSDKYHIIRVKMGSFFKQYEERYWYFEVIVIGQKMLLAGAMSVIAPRSPLQLLIGFFVCTVYLLVVLKTSPYVEGSLDVLSFLSSLAVGFTLLGGLIKRLDGTREEPDAGMDGFNDLLDSLLIGINCIPILYASYDLVQKVWLNRNKKEEKGGGIGLGQKDGTATSNKSKVVPITTRHKNEKKVHAAAAKAWEISGIFGLYHSNSNN